MAGLRKGHAVVAGAKQKRVQKAVDCNDNEAMLSVTRSLTVFLGLA